MKKWVLAATAAIGLAGSANAGVITLQGIAANGPNDFTFTYQGTLGPDEGVVSGDRLIIYDFGGYIDGSIFSSIANVSTSTELVSGAPAQVTPGFTDDPTLVNLVFTYTGPDFRASGGPFDPFDFNGLGARSIYGGVTLSAFYGLSTKNNPDGQPGGTGSDIITLGSVSTPAVPEPASWAMLIGGFGLAGAAMRRRTRITVVTA
jgi:hypothetical protein